MNPSPERLERFLFASLSKAALSSFYHDVKKDQALRRQLESESTFEAQAYARAWWTQGSLENAGPKGHFSQGGKPELFSRQEWESLIKHCLSLSEHAPVPTGTGRKIIAFPRPLRYLAAACFVGMIIGSVFFIQRVSTRSTLPSIVTMGVIQNPKETTAAAKQSSSLVVFDSLSVFGSPPVLSKPIATRTNDGIVRLGEKTAVLVEKNSTVKVTAKSDSTVTMTLSQGTALFSIEKKRYQRFAVHTPFSEVVVTGTIFRLAVDEQATTVSVFEGSVRTRGLHDSTMTIIQGGMSARITLAGVTFMPGDTAATLPHRPNLLRDFLMENGVWMNGAVIRTGIRSDATDLSTRFHSLRHSIIGSASDAPAQTFDFAYKFPNSSMTGELLLDLSAMFLRQGDTATALSILDSTRRYGDNDHIAEAFHRSALLCLASSRDITAAQHLIMRYLSRFPYDPRSFSLLGILMKTLYQNQKITLADSLLKTATILADRNVNLERIVFQHAEHLKIVAKDFKRSLDWYLFLADHYPHGRFKNLALDNATKCMILAGIKNREKYSRSTNDFLHPDGLKR